MKVMGKYVLIDPKKEGQVKTKSGLDLGSVHRQDIRYREAAVIDAGIEVSGVTKDDNIYYDRHAGFDLEVDGTVYKVIKEFDIVIVL